MPFESRYQEEALTRAELDATAGPVVVEFGTDWCGFCQRAQAAIRHAMERHAEVRHIKVEDGPGRPLGRSFRVKLWPTLVVMRDGVVLHQVSRPTSEQVEAAFETLG